MRIETYRAKISGVCPTIMHSNRLVNPFDSLTKAFKKLTSKQKKSEEDLREISRIEWVAGLYVDSTTKAVGWPGDNIKAMLCEAAKRTKKGKECACTVQCRGHWPLAYEGPRDIGKLWDATNEDGDRLFVSIAPVGVRGSTVLRTRPIFREWALEFRLDIDVDVVDPSSVKEWLVLAGRYIGLSDWRPKYGLFEVEEFKEETKRK